MKLNPITDLVLWDSHPLQLGATPTQVFIDGIAQLKSPSVVEKPAWLQRVPETPNFDNETKKTIEYEGLPPLEPTKAIAESIVAFINVSNIWDIEQSSGEIHSTNFEASGVVITQGGNIVCSGAKDICASHITSNDTVVINLEGGSVSPGLVSYGSDLGLGEIAMEDSTVDGTVFDAFSKQIPDILGGDSAVIRAADGLMFSTRNQWLAYRAGVTSAITAPASGGFFAGLSAHFSTGAPFKITPGAVIQDVTALHVTISSSGQPSVSTQIATLRRLLTEKHKGDLGHWINKVLKVSDYLYILY